MVDSRGTKGAAMGLATDGAEFGENCDVNEGT